MILIAGGTGRLGTALVELCHRRGERVRTLSRHDGANVPPACELAVGDVREPHSLGLAMRGADAVVSAVHGFAGTRGAGPAEVDYLGNVHLAEAAAAHGVRRFILISVYDARADSPMELHRAKFAAESYLRRTALDWTIIRPTAFLETWLQVIANEPGGPPLVFGSGRNPINFVSVSDVASAVDNALTSTAAIGRVMNVTGPQNLTMLEMAHACSGRRVKRIPRTALRVMGQLARPISPAFARQARTALAMDSIDMTARTGDSPDTVRRSLADVPPDSTK